MLWTLLIILAAIFSIVDLVKGPRSTVGMIVDILVIVLALLAWLV